MLNHVLLVSVVRRLGFCALCLFALPACAAPRFCISDDALLFGDRAVGSATTASVSVSNCGDATWSFTGVYPHPATNAQFHLTAQCAMGLTLAPGQSCRIDVTFAPLQAGEVSGALWLYNSTSTPDQLLTFYGRGVDARAGTAALAFDPPGVDFGPRALQMQAGPLVVNLRNVGMAPLVPSAMVMKEPDGYDFETASYGEPGECAVGTPIAAGASCHVNLFFLPLAGGPRYASLVVDAPQLASLAFLPISGTGVAPHTPGTVDVIEFYHAASGQYFLTADAAEAGFLDAGGLPGWIRTGATFHAWSPDDASVAVALTVCRFFGVPGGGPNSHFYSADAAECAAVRLNPHWIDEGIAFRAVLPAAGMCPGGYSTVTRLWLPGNDVTQTRHRYVVDAVLIAPMQAQGWQVEGPVFCAPP